MRALPLLAALALAAPFALALAPPRATQEACPGEREIVTFASGKGVLENLLFDGAGHLLVTGDGKLRRFAPDGGEEILLSGAAAPGGGLAIGPDGALYAGQLNSAAESLARSGKSSVVRFASLDPPVASTYSAGFDMANGLAFDEAGNLYVSNDFGDALVRVPRAHPALWEAWADVYGTNGLVVADGAVFAAITFDQASPIVAIPLADPSDVSRVATLSFGAASLAPAVSPPSDASLPLVPKGLDDMTRGDDGLLYATANAAGEVLRVDPATGAACVFASGLQNPSSARFAHAFGGWDGALFVTAFDGSITAIR